MDRPDLQETLATQGPQVRREAKEKMEAQDFLVSWVPVGLREKLETKELQERRALLGSLESLDPKEKGETPGPKGTRDCQVGRASLETLESQATRAILASWAPKDNLGRVDLLGLPDRLASLDFQD